MKAGLLRFISKRRDVCPLDKTVMSALDDDVSAGASAASPHALVILTSVSKLYATKRIRLNLKRQIVKSNYGRETHFSVQSLELTGFAHMCRALDRLTGRRYSFVVRGQPRLGIDLENARRLLHPDPETGAAATFVAAPRRWFAVDMDKVPCPAATDPVDDPDAAIEHLIGLLPPELWDASCWWQLTSCQSLPGYEDTLSARLWFWLAEPLDDASLTRWAHSANKGGKIVDPSIYRAVQPHYVADPIFDGMRDPLPRRHGVRVGLDELVSLLIPEPSANDPYIAGDGYVGIGVEGHLGEIGGERGFRAPMLSAIAAYFAANGADADSEVIKARVREAIDRAPCGGRSDADIACYQSDRHLNDIVGWVRARERTSPRNAEPKRPFNEVVDDLAGAVPVAGERARTVKLLATHLFRRLDRSPRLAAELVRDFNAARCAPPLPIEQVDAILADAAARRITALNSGWPWPMTEPAACPSTISFATSIGRPLVH